MQQSWSVIVVQFAQNLARIMQEKNLTKYRLAKLMPCSQSSVAGWLENREPRGIMRARLLEVLDVTEEELFYGIKKIPDPVKVEDEEFIQLYQAAPQWLKDQVRALLAAAAAGDGAPDVDSTEP